MSSLNARPLAAAAMAAALLLCSCGGDNYGPPCLDCVVPSVQFDATLTGLAAGTSIVLGDTTGLATTRSQDGSFSYRAYLPPTSALPLIGVLVQPTGQNCSVTNGAPNASGIVNVAIACNALPSPPPAALALYAGWISAGAVDATGTGALFNAPSALATDAAGNVYVADTNNDTIRKIAPGGIVTTLAGAAGYAGASDGTGGAARFNGPGALATDASGNVYVADTFNNTIRKVTPAGAVTTIAGTAGMRGSTDGTGAAARFNLPLGIAVDSAGTIYVADFYNNTIRAISPSAAVTTLAGSAGVTGSANGTGAAASFNGPQGIALDASGNIYVADTYNDTVREVTPGGVVTTLAGLPGVAGAADGSTSAATFFLPLDVVLDGSGNVYVADNGNNLVREISGGAVSTIAGTAGQNLFSAGTLPGSLQNPTSLAYSGTSLYITTLNAVAVIGF